jgi:RNA polymerase primary sigma factor
MASSPKVTPQKDKVSEREEVSETSPDSPLLDLSEAAIKKLIRTAKKRGYVTHEQINSLSKQVNSEQIEDVLAMFSEMGVNVVETEEANKEGEEQLEEPEEGAEGESSELIEVQRKAPAKSEAKEPAERTDDPVRMYLREMGSVELLSREGENAIAKRIEVMLPTRILSRSRAWTGAAVYLENRPTVIAAVMDALAGWLACPSEIAP